MSAASCASGTALDMQLRMIVVGAVFNIVSDLVVMALGFGVLKGLQVSLSRKIGLGAIFSVRPPPNTSRPSSGRIILLPPCRPPVAAATDHPIHLD